MPLSAITPEPIWTVIWESDKGKNWDRLPRTQAAELVENLVAYGVDQLLIFQPNSNAPITTLETENIKHTAKHIILWDSDVAYGGETYAAEKTEAELRELLPNITVLKNIRIIPPGTPIMTKSEFLQESE